MPRITIELPGLLGPVVNGERTVGVEAASLAEALRGLIERHPALAVHLFDETGTLRKHVLCFHNEANTRWLDCGEIALAEGDVITIMQAVSGG